MCLASCDRAGFSVTTSQQSNVIVVGRDHWRLLCPNSGACEKLRSKGMPCMPRAGFYCRETNTVRLAAENERQGCNMVIFGIWRGIAALKHLQIERETA